MLKNTDYEARTTTGSGIGLFLSLFAGIAAGYWAYSLDPTGKGGSILVLPAILVVGVISIAFVVTGIIGRNEAYGWSFVIGGIAIPGLFMVSGNIFRTVFGS